MGCLKVIPSSIPYRGGVESGREKRNVDLSWDAPFGHLQDAASARRSTMADKSKAHEASYLLSHHHLHRLSNRMCFKNPFAELKKKLKRQLAGGRHEPERRGTNTGGEGIELSDSLAPESHVGTGGGDSPEGNGATEKGAEVGRIEGDGTGGRKTEEADSPSQPDTVPLLKSVADGLAAVLKHYEVRPISPTTLYINDTHYFPSNQWTVVK